MFPRFADVPWVKLGNIGEQWCLVSYAARNPPTWETFWADHRTYWGADAPDKSRVRLYFGETNTEENLLRDGQKKYLNLKEYMLHWNGLCKVGEVVQVIHQRPNCIALSKNWKGVVADHSEIEVWLKQELAFPWRRVRFCCELYNFGTIVVPPGSIEAQMGERVGSSRVSHRRGLTADKNETVVLAPTGEAITVGDAHFGIVA